MERIVITKSQGETKRLGERFAREIIRKRPLDEAVVIGLEGDLGGGKTTFLQGFAKGLGVKEKILSPTFVILKRFHVPYSMFHDFYHIDCYRIQKPKEILSLGFKKIISDPKNIVAVEWADRVQKVLPRDIIVIRFDFVDQKTRKITPSHFKK